MQKWHGVQMVIKGISRAVRLKQKNRYQVRWLEDGIPRTRSTFKDKAAADEFRRELIGRTSPPPPTKGKKRGPKPKRPPAIVDASFGGDIEASWDVELEFYRDAVRLAFEARDDAAMDLAAKAARAVSTLVTAHASNRDIRKLKAALEELKAWRKTVTTAAAHGTRIEPARGGAATPSGSLRREKSIH